MDACCGMRRSRDRPDPVIEGEEDASNEVHKVPSTDRELCMVDTGFVPDEPGRDESGAQAAQAASEAETAVEAAEATTVAMVVRGDPQLAHRIPCRSGDQSLPVHKSLSLTLIRAHSGLRRVGREATQ